MVKRPLFGEVFELFRCKLGTIVRVEGLGDALFCKDLLQHCDSGTTGTVVGYLPADEEFAEVVRYKQVVCALNLEEVCT